MPDYKCWASLFFVNILSMSWLIFEASGVRLETMDDFQASSTTLESHYVLSFDFSETCHLINSLLHYCINLNMIIYYVLAFLYFLLKLVLVLVMLIFHSFHMDLRRTCWFCSWTHHSLQIDHLNLCYSVFGHRWFSLFIQSAE